MGDHVLTVLSEGFALQWNGASHDWGHVIVWIENPDIEYPKILGMSPSAHGGHSRIAPPADDTIDGTSVKVNYEASWPMNHELSITNKGGDTQDLVMWDQMTNEARDALNQASFGEANVPFNDWKFENNLKSGYPW